MGARPAGQAAHWRVLLVDDCADDAELTMIELRAGGVEAECRCVDSESALLATLRSGFVPDLVLSDLNMPGFSGAVARALICEHAPRARFVVLTGALDERAGVPAADAVLLKHELHRLPGVARGLLGVSG